MASDLTLSRPLATKVENFNVYDEKTVIFTTSPDEKGVRSVAYAAVDITSPVALNTYADGQPLHAAMSSYFGRRYVAVVHGQALTVTSGSLPTLTDKGSMKQFAAQTIPAGASDLTVHNSRFFVAQLPDGYATYDIELKKYDKTTWADQSQAARPISWLDDYMIWSDAGGKLRFYEFDGANQQTIMPVAEGFMPSLSQNDKYLYAIAKTDKGFALERARMILN